MPHNDFPAWFPAWLLRLLTTWRLNRGRHMAQIRTAKGTASSKTSTTTLTLSSVAADEGATLVVGIAYEDTQGDPTSIKWGNKDLKQVRKRNDATNGFSVAIWRTRVRRPNQNKNIVVTWSSAITKKVLFATQITEASKEDVGNGNLNASTGAPATGAAVTTTVANTIHIAAFASEGPANDTAGTAGVGHTLGQRVGVNGAPPASNITIQETYEILTATGNSRSTLSGATSRNWASIIVAFGPTRTYTVTKAFRNLRVTDSDADDIILVVDSGTDPNDIFEVRIDPDIFDGMSDAEVDDFIKKACVWHSDHHIDDETDPPSIPSAQQTKMDNLVNDTFNI